MYFSQLDYPGLCSTVTDKTGGTEQKFSFGPWGNRRNPDDWSYNNIPTEYMFDRGYTGHEHLDIFGLINMNGRTYDPQLGRMLSPDNFVQAPNSTQSFNRYSYVLNNPLVYTDPSGEFIWYPIIGGAINTALQYAQGNIDSFEGAAMAFGQGAIGGLMAAGGGASLLETALGSASSAFPGVNLPVGNNLTFHLSPMAFMGTGQIGFGANIGASYREGNHTFSMGVSFRDFGRNFGPSGKSFEAVLSGGYKFDDGTTKFSAHYSRFFSGETKQSMFRVKFGGKDWSLSIENDWSPIKGYDRFRTHGMELTVGDFSAGLMMYTGDPGPSGYRRIIRGDGYGPKGSYNGVNANKYNTGVWYLGYKNYRFGRQSDRIRQSTQDPFHNFIGSSRFQLQHDKITSWYPWYFQFVPQNSYTQW